MKVKYIQFTKWFDTLPSSVRIVAFQFLSGAIGILLTYLVLITNTETLKEYSGIIVLEMAILLRNTIINVLTYLKLKSDSKITEVIE